MHKTEPQHLNEQDLIFKHAFVDGTWVEATNKSTFTVNNPLNQSPISQVANLNAKDTELAIESAHKALDSWRSTLPSDRSRLLMKWHDLILENQESLARLMVNEQGKPYPEARGEIKYGASFIKWFAEEILRDQGSIIPPFAKGRRLLVLRQAVGVVAAITPWNFPNAMITRKCAPALASGCTVVVKPAEDTPLSALALAELARRAGFPKGVFNVVTCDREQAAEVGKMLCTHPLVRKVGFTGSTVIGKRVMSLASSTVKRVSLELGGNAPLIIFEDADLKLAMKGLFASKFRNAGQTCICANRIFVHESIMQEFSNALVAKCKSLQLGDGAKQGTDIGPLINARAVERVSNLLTQAQKAGAQILYGGRILNEALQESTLGVFLEPTVITGLDNQSELAQSELFAPIVHLIPFNNEKEVLHMANDTPYGLAAYFFTEDHRRIWRVSEGLEYGMVGVNDGLISNTATPFGGVKESGIGREGSSWGLDEFVEVKYVMLGGLN